MHRAFHKDYGDTLYRLKRVFKFYYYLKSENPKRTVELRSL
jgi:hypothetical protein